MSFGVETETTGFGLDLRGETIPRHAQQAEGDGQQGGRAAGIRDAVARVLTLSVVNGKIFNGVKRS